MPTVQLRTRIDLDLKRKSSAILKSIGLDEGSFVSMALTQLVNRRGLPFAVTESDQAYFEAEYGLTPAEKVKAGLKMQRETARARKNSQLKEIRSAADLTP
jgi:addiction module RelB/DinJ family antitoxin